MVALTPGPARPGPPPAASPPDPPPATLPPDPPAAAPGPDAFDPWAGMDRDGRIPAVEKPADFAHPERWRYIPEGRLKPGNLLQRFLVSSFIVPIFFHDADVGTGGGVAITDIDFRQQRRREFAGIFLTYTTEGQQDYTISWRRWIHQREREGGGVFQEERSFWRASAGYEKTLTRRFYGLDDSDEGDETSYTDEMFHLQAGIEASLPDPGSNWVGRFGLRGEFHELSDGHVGGKPDTGNVFPGLFDDAEHAKLGWVRAGLRYDTRDSRRNPYRGWHVGVRAEGALLQTHGDLGGRFTFEAGKYVALPGLFHAGGGPDEEDPPTDVLALGFESQLAAGELPFFARPSLGGSSTLRGYLAGRFRGDATWTGMAEYRFWVLPRGFPIWRAVRVERLGLALFYEAGAVASDVPDFFGKATVRHVGGVGLRLMLERAAPFRVDVGFSEEDVHVTARFGLSF